jgi:hypothetical protein
VSPTRKQLLTILAQSVNIPEMGGDAYGIDKRQLLLMCLTEGDLEANLSASIYDGYDRESGMYVFMKTGLEKFMDTTKERAEKLEKAGELQR